MNAVVPPDEVSYRIDRAIAHLVLEQEKLSLAGIAAMTQRITAAADCRALIISSAGSNFCRGRAPGPRPTSPEQARREIIDPILDLYRVLHAAPFPILTAVSGSAHGLGFALALSGDVVFADPEATFALPESKAGFPPLLAMSQLADVISPKMLASFALSARPTTATALAAAGIIGFLAPANELTAIAQDFAEQLPTSAAVARSIVSFTRRDTAQCEADFARARQIVGDALANPE